MSLVIIDGTGPEVNKHYNQMMASSFCSQIASQVTHSTYLRGPTVWGVETDTISINAFNAITNNSVPLTRIVLVGYSRGGCAAILTAKRLKEAGLSVDALFLFDAVDMQFSNASLSQVIPDNVRYVAHARTARSLSFWVKNPVKSRFYFYNTGRWLAGSGTLDEASFVGTHGAAGGVPWPDISGDQQCSLEVAAWMTTRLNQQGVPVQLRA